MPVIVVATGEAHRVAQHLFGALTRRWIPLAVTADAASFPTRRFRAFRIRGSTVLRKTLKVRIESD